MPDTNWEKVVEIFESALNVAPDERAAFLSEACGDENLRAEVEAMLAADERADAFLENPAIAASSISLFPENFSKPETDSFVGKMVGAYRLVREIGRGGMGAVYLAERADGAFQKRVAVKLIRRDMNSEFLVSRFRQERQILAALDHPNIARLLDGGRTEAGEPYFIMEYIEGEPLFDYCEKNRLNLRARLRLFAQICVGVEFAHEQNVLHRDIKPSNILVDRNGVPKLLDFGIAKLENEDFGGEQTATGRWLMTPEYASPEQAAGKTLTRASDVYSLGVILYELIGGQKPYKFASRAPHEIARVVCETEPAPLADKNADKALGKIVFTALEKHPENRFATVGELKTAIADYLNDSKNAAEVFPATRAKETVSVSGNQNNSNSGAGAPRSLAILPFRRWEMSRASSPAHPSGDDAFLELGLADALTTRLSNVKQLVVRPTSSVLQFSAKSEDSFSIGKQLEVDFVLEGSVSPSNVAAARVRIAVQLLRVADNNVLWASQFDEDAADIFALQDTIAEKTAVSLVPQLTESEQARLQQRGTSNEAAYKAYLRGRAHFYSYEAAGITQSIIYLQEAARLDPNFALAYAGIADYYNWMEVYSQMRPSEAFAAAKEAARRAIELDPQLAEPYASLAFAAWGGDWDFVESERLYRRAIELNPNNPRAHEWFSFLLQTVGRNDEAVAAMRAAQRLDPQSAAHLAGHHYVLFMARRYEEAEAMARRGLSIAPENVLCEHSFGWSSPFLGKTEEGIESARRAVARAGRISLYLTTLGYNLAIGGYQEEALEILREMDAREAGGEYFPQTYFAVIHTGLGEINRAFARLDKNKTKRDHWRTTLLFDPRLDLLRQDPRFERYAREIYGLYKPETAIVAKVENPKNEFLEIKAEIRKIESAPEINRAADGITLSWRFIAFSAVGVAALLLLILLYMIADTM
jgi:eukaryotic-like serine/threonine-protein kinase